MWKVFRKTFFADDCSIMAQLLIFSSKHLKKISVQNIFSQTFFADDVLRKLKWPQDLRVPHTDYGNTRLKGLYKLIDWETPQRLRWGPQIADICFWLLENDRCLDGPHVHSLTMLIASSHILYHAGDLDHQDSGLHVLIWQIICQIICSAALTQIIHIPWSLSNICYFNFARAKGDKFNIQIFRGQMKPEQSNLPTLLLISFYLS